MEAWRIWIEKCEAARSVADEFGTRRALDYLVGEKFLNFLESADTHPELQADIPAFAAEVRAIFEPRQLSEVLDRARKTKPFDAGIYDDEAPEVEEEGTDVRGAGGLIVVERAREWLLGQGEG